MSKFTTVAGALIVSSLLLSPFSIAEESQSFVAQNEARHAAFEQHQEVLAAQAKENLKTQQASASQQQDVTAKHT